MGHRMISCARAEPRVRACAAWLADQPRGAEVVIVAPSLEIAAEHARALAVERGAVFGVHRTTLPRFAAELAAHALADRDLATVGGLAIEALCARVVAELARAGTLGRLAAIADRPGLPRALARTLGELRLAGATRVPAAPELDAALVAFGAALATARLADLATVLELAAVVTDHPLLARPLLLCDVAVRTRAEQRLVAAIAARAPAVLATVPTGDARTIAHLEAALGVAVEIEPVVAADSLSRVQAHLFARPPQPAALDDTVAMFSAPGESRECVEIARRILRAAEAGTPFDRIAVLLHTPDHYRVHLEEALGRAGVPAHFDQGTVLPDPSGRAFLALLACAGEQLSARRFAEYLSLGEVPAADVDGAPPAALDPAERWFPPDDELLPTSLGEGAPAVEPAPPSSRAPWRWERLLVDAAVIGGRERWARRLAGLAARVALDDDPEHAERRDRTLADIAELERFALPLLDALVALPALASWGDWLDQLSALATRALRRPERVLAVLAALSPMREVGPVELREVEQVLAPRLTELVIPPEDRRYGRVLVAPIEAARGRAFELVLVPGLAERMFPHKLVEDPLLLDRERTALDLGLPTRDDLLAAERLALRLAIGAASGRVVLSYPRIDLEQGRPRVPSFYGLEILEAAEGTLPGFDELARRADRLGQGTAAARIGWPAPEDPADAIDAAEHDLALLDGVLRAPDAAVGAASYLLGANPHLARALRSRARRWTVAAWKPADGFVVSTSEARAALDAHALTARSFSPTALEQLAACPLRFVLRTIARLEPREEPEPIESLGPLERGSLIHEVQFELLGELRTAGALPVTAATLVDARDRLDATLDRIAARYHDELAPAIDRVWVDGVASIRADLREWLRRMTDEPDWVPARFELAFGLEHDRDGRDPASRDEAVRIAAGLALRGSIDLVERRADGALRATDYKTGKAKVKPGAVIDRGRSLQPALYALVLEQLFPDTTVAGGRLDYCTTRGEFQTVMVPLGTPVRDAATLLAGTLAHHLAEGLFPAAPAAGECTYCDFRPICGPHEEQRAAKKQQAPLAQLKRLRDSR